MKFRAGGLLILTLILLFLVAPVLADEHGKTIEQIAAEQKIPIGSQVADFYNWAVGISALLALGILVYAGLAYTVAGGNASRQADAKQWIWNALIGLALLFGSYLILNTINPNLSKFQNLDLSQVKVEKVAEAPEAAKNLNLPELIGNFYQWALGIGGLIALGIIIFGGILYTISPGNSSRQGNAKMWIGSAIVGLVLLFGSYAILYTINPDLTKLRFELTPNKEVKPVSPETDTPSSPASPGPTDGNLSKLIAKQTGRKSLADAGDLFKESWKCGGDGGGSYQYASCQVSIPACEELQRNGAVCKKDVFIPILGLIQPPPGFLRIPLPTRFIAAFIPGAGFSLPADRPTIVGGNCETLLNPVLVDNLAALKSKFNNCPSRERCDVQPVTTACTSELVDNNDNHPIRSHLELRAADLALKVALEQSK